AVKWRGRVGCGRTDQPYVTHIGKASIGGCHTSPTPERLRSGAAIVVDLYLFSPTPGRVGGRRWNWLNFPSENNMIWRRTSPSPAGAQQCRAVRRELPPPS